MLIDILLNEYTSPEYAVIMFIIGVIVFFVSLSIHEFAHALAAYKMGDPTPKAHGRLTLNPFKHIDPIGFITFLFMWVGWAKPVPINPLNFKKYRKGIRIVSISGILANFLLGLLAAVIMMILSATKVTMPIEIGFVVSYTLTAFMVVNGALALFNFIPLVPLDGYNFVTSFMKTENKFIKFNLKHGAKILLGMIIVNILLDVMFSINILEIYLNLIFNYVYTPIVGLGGLF